MNARESTEIDASQLIQPSKWGVVSSKFGEIPAIDSHLFQVNPEIPAGELLEHAHILALSVRDTLLNTDDGLDGNQVWLLWNCVDQLTGLLGAIEIANKKFGE